MGFSRTNLFNKRIYNIKVSTWLTGISICYILIVVVLTIYYNNKLEKEGICTAGWATKISYGSYNRKYLDYEYRVDSAIYIGSTRYYGSIKKVPEDLYVVVYLKGSPHINAFLYNLTLDSLLLETDIDSLVRKDYNIDLNSWQPELSKAIKKSSVTAS